MVVQGDASFELRRIVHLLLVLSPASVLAPAVVLARPPIERRIAPRLDRAHREAPAATVAAVIRAPDDPSTIATLEAAGVRVRKDASGRARRVGSVLAVDAPARVLHGLARAGMAVEVGGPPIEHPTMVTGREIGSWAAQAHGPVPLHGPTGRGVTILDLDSAIDIFHPHFFNADGGAWPWVDVDGDGRLSPGIDGVDTNVDGEIADNELLRLLDFAAYHYETSGLVYEGLDDVLDPSLDYLYVDFDGNGRRDYGGAAGYDESAAGYGEPLFLPDDADGDGTMITAERLLLLGTSRITAWRHDGFVYERGEDLALAPIPNIYQSGHATSVIGSLVGGQDRIHRVHRGLLPDAEVVVADSSSADADLIESIAWAVDEHSADVVLHEYSGWVTVQLDGSRLIEQAIDESVDDGVVHVCPAGNLAAAGKHAELVTTVDPLDLAFHVPVSVNGNTLTAYWLDLHWRDPAVEMTCTLVDGSGQEFAVVEGDAQIDGRTLYATRWETEIGTQILSLHVIRNGEAISGDWHLRCTHDGVGTTVHAYFSDDASGWSDGAGVSAAAESLATTMCSPSTSQRCISVAAYSQQFDDYGPLGDLDWYSSRGPRMDGAKTLDIAAPSDPVTPYPDVLGSDLEGMIPMKQNNAREFGGTSGASPHVVAAAAMLRQAEPLLTPDEVKERLRTRAAIDEHVGDIEVPDDSWGYGKLRVHEAIFDEPAPERPAGVDRELVVEFAAVGDGVCHATVSVDGVDWASPSFRWDDDYDGSWDTGFIPHPERVFALTMENRELALRIEYGQAGWRVGGAALAIEAPPDCFETSSDTSSESGASTGGPLESDDTAGSSGDGAAADGSTDDGCGCNSSRRSGAALLVIPLLLARRRGPLSRAPHRRRTLAAGRLHHSECSRSRSSIPRAARTTGCSRRPRDLLHHAEICREI